MPDNVTDPKARSGGNAAAAGMAFQANVAAQFALALLGERALDHRLNLGESQPVSVRCETEAPVDDILIETSQGGHVFVQAKTSLDLSPQLNSGLGSAVQQAVRLWIACSEGAGKRRWDRPLDLARDRIVFATGPTASSSVSEVLPAALQRYRDPVAGEMIQGERLALDRFVSLVNTAWQQIAGRLPTDHERSGLLKLVRILQFDFGAADHIAAVEMLRHTLQDAATAESALHVLRQSFLKLMTSRRGVDAAALREGLIGLGVKLSAPPSYLRDIKILQAYSDRVRAHLENYERTAVDSFEVKIERRCTEAVVSAAELESLLLVGEPGAGKSAVVSAAAARLREAGRTVIELAVDRLPVSSLDGLGRELELTNSLVSVLRNWPGDETAFLFIDALDATRGGQSEAVFRSLIAEVLSLPHKRWRVVASIRSFDLRMGERFKELFHGKPPNGEFSDAAFGQVRHVSVPHWTGDELRQIEQQIPPIKTALERAGPRLRALAAVPFNTRLLADLLSSGVSADQFGDVTTQVELLGLYWSKRVTGHGPAAELCLRRAVAQMVEIRGLRADRLHVAEASPAGLESLLAESVLITLAGDRYVAFRHHILFDYAASRVYLDATNVDHTARLLKSESALGLMLGPALVFALQDVWSSDMASRSAFWTAVVRFVGDADCDPIIRSVAARTGCELPTAPSDFDGLVKQLDGNSQSKGASKTITHLVGSLSVRAEDKAPFPVPSWCKLAEQLSGFVQLSAWPLRTLLFLLIGRPVGVAEQADLGVASRRLLRFGLSEERGSALVNAAIGFVGDTYSTNVDESRTLLQKLFEPARFDKYGHEDVPWLTRKVAEIAKCDPQFVISIYANVFAGTITDTSETSLGQSRILPLTSNRRQDYEMAQWSLAEYFPKFLELYPREATVALIKAIEGYVLRQHPIREGAKTFLFELGGRPINLIEDWSYIWAHDPEDQHGDNALRLAVAFVNRMKEAPTAELLVAADEIIGRNALGIVWARLMYIAARRVDVLGSILWPLASRAEFLTLPDTMKDSTDVVANAYSQQSEAARAAFEHEILQITFPETSDSEDIRRYVLGRILGTIGLPNLVTNGARDALRTAAFDPNESSSNERPFRTSGVTIGNPDDFWWLRERGVDTENAFNAEILRLTKLLKEEFRDNRSEYSTPNFEQTLSRLIKFLATVDAATEAHELVRDDALGVFGEALNTLVNSDEKAAVATDGRAELIAGLINRLALSASPEVSDDTEKNFENSGSWGSPAPRVDAAHLALVMSRASKVALALLRGTILALMRDKHPAVRMAVATHVNAIWETDRPFMWELADKVVSEEQNLEVLRFFANTVLGRLVWLAPDQVERLILVLHGKAVGDKRGLAEEIGGLVGLLWIGSGRERARELIQGWLQDIEVNQEFVEHAVSVLRGNVIAGYEKHDKRAEEVRRRSHDLANWVIDATSGGLKSCFNLSERTQSAQKRATTCAKILDHVGNQFYFSSGAFRHGSRDEEAGLRDLEQKRAFIADVGAMLWKMSEVASPGTLHHLIELFEFLIPADPPQMFDLVAHALLGAGQVHGYQFESLGADRVVEIVGRFLADNRVIFEDDSRRKKLIECLDVFIEAGWPSARRLLYRLPELLQ
jgi:hypothetical protein